MSVNCNDSGEAGDTNGLCQRPACVQGAVELACPYCDRTEDLAVATF